MVDIDRLIDEKRSLERDLEGKNQRLFELERRPVRDGSFPRTPTTAQTTINEDGRMRNLNRVMAEKDNYI